MSRARPLNVAVEAEAQGLPRWPGLKSPVSSSVDLVRAGRIGALPIVVGLVIIWGIFQGLNPAFLSSRNLVNLATDCAAVGVIAIGVVLVLLVAQIDLSVGSMSGVASSLLGVLLTQEGWPLSATILAALAVGVVVGLIYGAVFVRFHVPSFVITLAGLLALLGFQLQLLGANGSINIPFNSGIVAFMQQQFLPQVLSYVLAAACAAAYLAAQLARARRRSRSNLRPASVPAALARTGLLLAFLEAGCWYFNQTRGVSLPFVLLAGLVIVFDFALKRTHWGRAVYAVGGSAEAARRAGIKVNRIYVSAFVLCSLLAAVGGLLSAGQLSAASISSGTGDVNLDAIAAAVIGGTSLFGGRGSAYSALLGIVVIQSIADGLTLLNLTSAARFMITGLVLLIAVIVDALARHSRTAHGVA